MPITIPARWYIPTTSACSNHHPSHEVHNSCRISEPFEMLRMEAGVADVGKVMHAASGCCSFVYKRFLC